MSEPLEQQPRGRVGLFYVQHAPGGTLMAQENVLGDAESRRPRPVLVHRGDAEVQRRRGAGEVDLLALPEDSSSG